MQNTNRDTVLGWISAGTFKYIRVKRSTGHTRTRTAAEHTTHMNTERAMAQRRFIVVVVGAALKIVVIVTSD